ncbi:MAG: GMC family oxidoreductase [Bacteroidota bacterium]
MSDTNTYDAIVVGSGISGGWAAKELSEKGLKTIVLERGRNVEHVKDYPTAMSESWDFKHRYRPTKEDKEIYYIQSQTGQFNEASKHWWVRDVDSPYQTPEEKPFTWIRGYHVGGRSIMWGRQSYRWSEMDFNANAKDGIGVPWPVSYDEIAPWYDYVEQFAGISGQVEGLPQLPDGKFLPPMEMNCVENHVKEKIAENFNGRAMTIGRTANLTVPHNGRGNCQYRSRCRRGCPYGAYFSSNAATLPAAAATGNMTLRPNSIVHSIIYDENKDKAVGVRVIDRETNEAMEFFARIIFLNASTFGSVSILLNSTTNRYSEGLGNASGTLGHYVMDHHFQVGAGGTFDDFADEYYYGRRPNGIYIPRFRNINEKHPDYIRGFGYQGGARRAGWNRGVGEKGFGADFKDSLSTPGPWSMGMTGFGECLPYYDNMVSLNTEKTDKWGLPTLDVEVEFKENEMKMRKDMKESAAEMLEAAGARDIRMYERKPLPGMGIHEMGGAPMGNDPKTSMLNKFNQIHEVPNVFVTDGAFMNSAACQNPSLTYMAFTARAAEHAVSEMKKGNL